MKTCFTILLLALLQVGAAQVLITKWTFNRSSNEPDSGVGSIGNIGGTAFSSYLPGNPSSGKAYGIKSFPIQSKNNEKAGILLRISTKGFKNLRFAFQQYNSNTSSRKTMVMVSADSINYTKVDSLITKSGSSWSTKAIDLTPFPYLSNKSSIYILLVSSFTGNQYTATGASSKYSTSGTWRFDNIKLTGTTMAASADTSITLISSVQGKGSSSHMLNKIVKVEGVVTAALQGANEQGGFYMQDMNPDNDPLTSDGIFVNSLINVSEGDHIKVTGKVLETFGQTNLSQISEIIIIPGKKTVIPINITFPLDSINSLEKYEGMKIKVSQQLTVTENYQLGRYGEITASVNGRLYSPTNVIDPNDNPKEGVSFSGNSNLDNILAWQSLNVRSKILICDKLNTQNPNPIPFLDPVKKTLRIGSTVDTLIGVLGFEFGLFRVYPSLGQPKFKYAVRPPSPQISGANLKVVGANLQNYFNGDGKGNGFPTSRGATTAKEFQRQQAKTIASLKALDADIYGLMEMENDGDSTYSAINSLVTALNTAYGSNTFDYIRDSKDINGNPGTDAIKVALIYRISKVTPNGLSKSYNDSAFASLGRPPLAQTFIMNSNGEKFTVIVNHFKSRGSATSQIDPLDVDQNDGQGYFNATRKKQATALLTFVNSIIQQSNDSDIISIGDYNAYEQEDPMDILRAGGLKSVLDETYSYVFDAQSGSLDHGFATPSMFRVLKGAEKWHINCDEPAIIDYTTTYKTQDLFNPDPYRSSDHDPLIVGFSLGKNSFVLENGTANEVRLYPQPNNGNFTIDAAGLEIVSFKIFNVNGALVYSENSFSSQKEIHTNLPIGLYFVTLVSADSILNGKLIIQ